MAYPTLAQCKVYMNITASGDDTTITQALDDAVAQVERETLRTFVAAADTREFPARAPFVTLNRTMLTPFDDLVSVTTLTNGDGEVIPSTAYYLLPIGGSRFYQLQLKRQLHYRFTEDSDGTLISLLGSWGFSAACPADIFRVILELTSMSYAIRSEGSGQEITAKGTIIDLSSWPAWMVDSVDRYVRK
ncbi:MAG: hypothetical protein ABFS03_03955 [Chloroflexota bacterium]